MGAASRSRGPPRHPSPNPPCPSRVLWWRDRIDRHRRPAGAGGSGRRGTPMSTARRSVGFIGLGQMGFGMATNLLKAGHDVLAHDVASEPIARFAASGGRIARNLKEIGAQCRSVMVMVVSGAQVQAVVSGPDGLLDTMTGGTIMVCSTIALSELMPVAERARARGVAVIDCPVSGGVTGAADGTL